VPSHHASQPAPLLRDGQMPPSLELGVHLAQLGSHPFRDRDSLQEEAPAPGLGADVRQAQEVEGLRTAANVTSDRGSAAATAGGRTAATLQANGSVGVAAPQGVTCAGHLRQHRRRHRRTPSARPPYRPSDSRIRISVHATALMPSNSATCVSTCMKSRSTKNTRTVTSASMYGAIRIGGFNAKLIG
jgi:hypothetical protein